MEFEVFMTVNIQDRSSLQ